MELLKDFDHTGYRRSVIRVQRAGLDRGTRLMTGGEAKAFSATDDTDSM